MAQKRAKAKRPPLSGLDKFLYGIAEILIYVSVFFLFLLLGDLLPDAVEDALYPNRIASHNDAAFLLSVPILITLGALAFWIELGGRQTRQPLFGNKKFKKPFGVPFLPAVPLFSREFWEKRTEEQKKKFRKRVFLWGCFLLISAVIYLSSIFSFTVMRSDRTVETYNTFHVKTESWQWEELQEMEISIYRRYKSSVRAIEVTFRYRDGSYEFGLGNFAHGTREDSLRELIDMKESLPAAKFTVPTEEETEKLLRSNNYTEEELALILKLIGYTP